jgi:hypothetical protein
VLQSDAKVLRLQNANGAALLVYPGFLMMMSGADIALVELRDIELTFRQIRFTEDESIPSDSAVVGHTWAKCNKDGSPDRRFRGNYQVPVAGYGGLVLKAPSGINEEYLISNPEKASRFAEAYSDYKRKLRELSARGPAAPAEQPKALEAKEPAASMTPAAPAYEWKSIPFLQTSDAASPQHAVKLMEQFMSMLRADIDGFSGHHSWADLEKFIRTLASIPGITKSFLDRSPGLARFSPKLTAAVTEVARDAVEQTRKAIERVDAATAAQADTQSALRAAREVEHALRA